MTTTVYTYPQFMRSPTSTIFSLIHRNITLRSHFTGAEQIISMPGSRWEATLTWDILSRAEGNKIKGFLARLGGLKTCFYLDDAAHRFPSGVGTGTPVVVSHTATSIVTSGWASSVEGILLSGDLFCINGCELKIMVRDTDSDESGNATLHFAPEIRIPPVSGSTVRIVGAGAAMRLKNDEQDKIQFIGGHVGSVSIECTECIFGIGDPFIMDDSWVE